MAGISVKFETDIRDFFERKSKHVLKAANVAVKEIGEKAKVKGRDAIAKAGFSDKWQNSLRLQLYEKDYAAFIFHKIPFSGVFEPGNVTIKGAPLLWLPLPSARKNFGSFGRLTPEKLIRQGYTLRRIDHPGRKPLLAARVNLQAGTPFNTRKTNTWQWVPIFVGHTSVTIKTKFDVTGAVREAAKDLPDAFVRALTAEEDNNG